MNAIFAIVLNDLRMLLRDRSACFFAIVFPILFACFFGAVFSRGGGDAATGLDIAVVDSDNSDASGAFVRALTRDAELRVAPAQSVEQARAAVLSRNAVAYIHVPAGFGAQQDQLFSGSGGAKIEVGIDPSREAESGWLQGIIQKTAYQQLATTFADPASSKRMLETSRASINASREVSVANRLLLNTLFSSLDTLGATTSALNQPTGEAAARPGAAPGNMAASPLANFAPITVETAPVRARSDLPSNAYAISFPQGMMWGIMGCAMGFAASLAGERTRGTFTRLCVSPLSARRILLAKGLAAAIVSGAVVLALVVMARVVFGVQPVEPLSLVLGAGATIIAFSGIMMFAATVGRSEQAVSRGGWGIMMMLAMLGGAAVPLFVMPAFMQRLSLISPVRWGMLALEGGIWRGSTFEAMLPTLGVLCAIGVAGMVAGMMLIGREAGHGARA